MSQVSNNHSELNNDGDAILEELGYASATCGICETILDNNNELTIKNHDCIKDYGKYIQDENLYVYPLCDDGSHIRKTMEDGQEKFVRYRFESTGDNDDSPNSNNLEDSSKSSTRDANFPEKLIQYVYERPALWNFKLPLPQRGFSKKQTLWMQISNCFSDTPSVDVLKTRWKNLCTSYARVKKAMKGKSGQAAERKRKWIYFDMMTFLDDVDLENQVTTSNVEDTISIDCAAAADESMSSLSNFQNIPDLSEVTGEEDFQEQRSYSNSNQRKQRKNSNNAQLLAAETLATAIQASTPIINFPSLPALPPPPPVTQASVFTQLMELKLNGISDETDREEVMDNVYEFLKSEIKRVRSKYN